MVGRVAEAQAKYETAIHHYKLADKWAEKANNKVTALHYYRIPYNIAVLLRSEGKYEESLNYADKALEYIEKEQGGDTPMLYALELKALNYYHLLKIDSALYYYNKAKQIATNINDATSRSRIDYSIFALLYNANDYADAEQNVKKLFYLLIVRIALI